MKIRNVLYHACTGKRVLALFIVTNLVYLLMLTVTIPKLTNYANGLRILDMMPFGYDFEYVNFLFEALGETGRQVYLFYQLPLDMVYPFLFGVCYCLLFSFVLIKLNKLESPFLYFGLLPFLVTIADYAENIGVVNLLFRYPELSRMTVAVTNIFTLLKSATSMIYFVILLIVLIWWAFKTLSYRIHYR